MTLRVCQRLLPSSGRGRGVRGARGAFGVAPRTSQSWLRSFVARGKSGCECDVQFLVLLLEQMISFRSHQLNNCEVCYRSLT